MLFSSGCAMSHPTTPSTRPPARPVQMLRRRMIPPGLAGAADGAGAGAAVIVSAMCTPVQPAREGRSADDLDLGNHVGVIEAAELGAADHVRTGPVRRHRDLGDLAGV